MSYAASRLLAALIVCGVLAGAWGDGARPVHLGAALVAGMVLAVLLDVERTVKRVGP